MNNFSRSESNSRFFGGPIAAIFPRPNLAPSQKLHGNSEKAKNEAEFKKVQKELSEVLLKIAEYKKIPKLTESKSNEMFRILSKYRNKYDNPKTIKNSFIAGYIKIAAKNPQYYPQTWEEVMQITTPGSKCTYKKWFDKNNNPKGKFCVKILSDLESQRQELQLRYDQLNKLTPHGRQNNGVDTKPARDS